MQQTAIARLSAVPGRLLLALLAATLIATLGAYQVAFDARVVGAELILVALLIVGLLVASNIIDKRHKEQSLIFVPYLVVGPTLFLGAALYSLIKLALANGNALTSSEPFVDMLAASLAFASTLAIYVFQIRIKRVWLTQLALFALWLLTAALVDVGALFP